MRGKTLKRRVRVEERLECRRKYSVEKPADEILRSGDAEMEQSWQGSGEADTVIKTGSIVVERERGMSRGRREVQATRLERGRRGRRRDGEDCGLAGSEWTSPLGMFF